MKNTFINLPSDGNRTSFVKQVQKNSLHKRQNRLRRTIMRDAVSLSLSLSLSLLA